MASPEIFRSFALRQRLHGLVAQSDEFLDVYEQLVQTLWKETKKRASFQLAFQCLEVALEAALEALSRTVLMPWLKGRLASTERNCFSYQWPPTLRVQPGKSQE